MFWRKEKSDPLSESRLDKWRESRKRVEAEIDKMDHRDARMTVRVGDVSKVITRKSNRYATTDWLCEEYFIGGESAEQSLVSWVNTAKSQVYENRTIDLDGTVILLGPGDVVEFGEIEMIDEE